MWLIWYCSEPSAIVFCKRDSRSLFLEYQRIKAIFLKQDGFLNENDEKVWQNSGFKV